MKRIGEMLGQPPEQEPKRAPPAKTDPVARVRYMGLSRALLGIKAAHVALEQAWKDLSAVGEEELARRVHGLFRGELVDVQRQTSDLELKAYAEATASTDSSNGGSP